MKVINIANLKNNLSLYLRKVRNGEEIIVRNRNTIVAKIVPWRGEQDDELLALASQGKIFLRDGAIDNHFWQMPAPQVSAEALNYVMTVERKGA